MKRVSFSKPSDETKNLTLLVKQTGWSFSGKVFSQAFQMVIGILMANMLGPFFLGIYHLGIKVSMLLLNFAKLGLDIGLARYIPILIIRDKGNAKVLLLFILRTGLLCSISLSALLFIFSNYIAIGIFNKPDLAGVLKIFSFYLPLVTLNYLLVHANRGAKQIKYNIIFREILYSVAFCSVLIVMYVVGWNFHLMMISIVFVEGASTILLFISLRWTFRFPVTLGDLLKKAGPNMGVTKRELFSFSTPLLFQSLILFSMESIDVLMLGYFRSSEMVGIYSIALKIAMLISFILYSFQDVFMPIISEKFIEGDFAGIKYVYQVVTKWIFFVTLMFVGIVFLMREDIILVFGEEYLPAAIPLLVLCAGRLINAVGGGVGIILISMGHQKLVLLNSIILLLFGAIFNYLFIEYFGLNILGAAIGSSISITLVTVIRLAQLKILRGIQPYNKQYIKVIIAFIPAYFLTHILLLNVTDMWNVWRIIIGSAVFLTINISIYLLIGMSEEDKMIFNKVRSKVFGTA